VALLAEHSFVIRWLGLWWLRGEGGGGGEG